MEKLKVKRLCFDQAEILKENKNTKKTKNNPPPQKKNNKNKIKKS